MEKPTAKYKEFKHPPPCFALRRYQPSDDLFTMFQTPGTQAQCTSASFIHGHGKELYDW